jgi:hypothetical protein
MRGTAGPYALFISSHGAIGAVKRMSVEESRNPRACRATICAGRGIWCGKPFCDWRSSIGVASTSGSTHCGESRIAPMSRRRSTRYSGRVISNASSRSKGCCQMGAV